MQHTYAVSSGDIVNSGSPVRRRTHQFGPHRVEIHVQNLINVSSQRLENLSWTHVPYFTSPVDTPSCHELPWKLELSGGNFSLVVFKHSDAFSCIYIPNLNLVNSTLAVQSKDPVTILSPSAEKFKLTISPVWPY